MARETRNDLELLKNVLGTQLEAFREVTSDRANPSSLRFWCEGYKGSNTIPEQDFSDNIASLLVGDVLTKAHDLVREGKNNKLDTQLIDTVYYVRAKVKRATKELIDDKIVINPAAPKPVEISIRDLKLQRYFEGRLDLALVLDEYDRLRGINPQTPETASDAQAALRKAQDIYYALQTSEAILVSAIKKELDSVGSARPEILREKTVAWELSDDEVVALQTLLDDVDADWIQNETLKKWADKVINFPPEVLPPANIQRLDRLKTKLVALLDAIIADKDLSTPTALVRDMSVMGLSEDRTTQLINGIDTLLSTNLRVGGGVVEGQEFDANSDQTFRDWKRFIESYVRAEDLPLGTILAAAGGAAAGGITAAALSQEHYKKAIDKITELQSMTHSSGLRYEGGDVYNQNLQEAQAQYLNRIEEEIKQAAPKEVTMGNEFRYIDPKEVDLPAWKAEWRRLWEIAQKMGKPEFFFNYVQETFYLMEKEIDDFSGRSEFSTADEGRRYLALKQFFQDLGYTYNDSTHDFAINVENPSEQLVYFASFLHNRLSLADQFHEKGVSKSMFANWEKTVNGTFPKYGRYVLDFFIGTASEKENQRYKHFPVIRALDMLLMTYFDETPIYFLQVRNETGQPLFYNEDNPTQIDTIDQLRNSHVGFGKIKPLYQEKFNPYVARDVSGLVIDQDESEAELQSRNPTAIIENKYSRDDYIGYVSFGRGAWMSAGGDFKATFLQRLPEDFACLKGVRKVQENGETVYYYGSVGNETRLTQGDLFQAIRIAMAYNACTASRAETFVSLYYAIGKSPNDDENLDLMFKCFPLAKELNLCKETVLELPYIVGGGDVSNEWLAEGARKIGLVKFVVENRDIFAHYGINSEDDFFAPIIFKQDGREYHDIKGLVAIREVEVSERLISTATNSDFNRFRNILRSIYVSRLKRDLLNFHFLSTTGEPSVAPVAFLDDIVSDKTQSSRRKNEDFQAKKNNRFGREDEFGPFAEPTHLAPFVATPRDITAEYTYEEAIDLSRTIEDGRGEKAKKGDPYHTVALPQIDNSTDAYKRLNEKLPTLTGDINKDIELIVEDLKACLKHTSLMKKDEDMVTWVLFFQQLQLRTTRLIIDHLEKHKIFEKRLKEPGERLVGAKVASHDLVYMLREYISTSGQTKVGSKELIYNPITGEYMSITQALLFLLPHESVPGDTGGFMMNVARGLLQGHNPNSRISRANASIYAGGIEQKMEIITVDRSPYAHALERYNLLHFLDKDTAPLTNTLLFNEHNESVGKAQKAQEEEKEKK